MPDIDFALWNEAEHPRDENGRFADKRGLAKSLVRQLNGINLDQSITYTSKAGTKTVPPHVTAAIRERLRQNPVDPKNILDMYEKQSTEQEKALGRDWYPNAARITEALAAEHGVSRAVVAGLIANYSPQKPWGQNLIEASEALRLRRAIGGRGNKDNPLTGKGIMATDAQAARGSEALGSRIGIPVHPEDVFAPKVTKKGAKSAGQALKIRNFFKLVYRGGDDDSVVVDRHAYGVARGIAMTEAEYTSATPSSDALYEEAAEAYRAAARALSEKQGRRVTPSEVQAVTWLTRQRLNSKGARQTLGQQDWVNLRAYVKRHLPHLQEEFFGGGAQTGYNLSLAFEMLSGDIDLAVWREVDHPRNPDGKFRHKADLAKAALRQAMIVPTDPRYPEVQSRKAELEASPPGTLVNVTGKAGGQLAYRDPMGYWRDPEEGNRLSPSALADAIVEAGNSPAVHKPTTALPPALRDLYLVFNPVKTGLPDGWRPADPIEAWGISPEDPTDAGHFLLAMDGLNNGDIPLLFKHKDGHVVQVEPGALPADDVRRLLRVTDESLKRVDRPGSHITASDHPVTFTVPAFWGSSPDEIAFVLIGQKNNVVVNPYQVPNEDAPLQKKRPFIKKVGHFPPSAFFSDDPEMYAAHAITHELGHINDARGGHVRLEIPEGEQGTTMSPIADDEAAFFESLMNIQKGATNNLPLRLIGLPAGEKTLSLYGQGHPAEGYAEAFAEYFAHRAHPDEVPLHPVAAAYAERYGWNKTDPSGR